MRDTWCDTADPGILGADLTKLVDEKLVDERMEPGILCWSAGQPVSLSLFMCLLMFFCVFLPNSVASLHKGPLKWES